MSEAKHEVHHPSDLNLFHKNPHKGDVDAIAASLEANDQYSPVIVNRGSHTKRPLEVLAGNHTVKAFRDLIEKDPDNDRWQTVDCWVIDVDDDRAIRIVTADNRTSELGDYDQTILLELLSEIPEAQLESTGYQPGQLDALRALLEPEEEPEGESSDALDQDILDQSDRAVWPMIEASLPPDLLRVFREIPAQDDAQRIAILVTGTEDE